MLEYSGDNQTVKPKDARHRKFWLTYGEDDRYYGHRSMPNSSRPIDRIVSFPNDTQWTCMRVAGAWFRDQIKMPDYTSGYRIELQFHDSVDTTTVEDGAEAVTLMRHSKFGDIPVYGPYAQRFNIANPFLTVTFVHELCHLVDRFNVGAQPANFRPASSHFELFAPLWRAYAQTESAKRLYPVSQGWILESVYVEVEDCAQEGGLLTKRGVSSTDLFQSWIQEEAVMMLLSHEVFARCLSAHILYTLAQRVASGPKPNQRHKDIVNEFERRQSGRAGLYGADLTYADYQLVKVPLTDILKKLDWWKEPNA